MLHCSTGAGVGSVPWCAKFMQCVCSCLDRLPATEAGRTLGCCLGSHFDDVLVG